MRTLPNMPEDSLHRFYAIFIEKSSEGTEGELYVSPMSSLEDVKAYVEETYQNYDITVFEWTRKWHWSIPKEKVWTE